MTVEKRKPKHPKRIFQTLDGQVLKYKGVKKFFRDLIAYHNGVRAWEKGEYIEVPDANLPLGSRVLAPGNSSPICEMCGMDRLGSKHPYLPYAGSDQPVATILVEAVSQSEDTKGGIGSGKGQTANLIGIIHKLVDEHGVALEDIRWVPITRCACRIKDVKPNYRSKGNWCRYYAVQDLLRHPPKVVIPVGGAALALLSYKTNAETWSGKLLTWRGWPDDWLTDPNFVLDRPDPVDPGKMVRGHPLFGPPPATRIPLVPLQHPGQVHKANNVKVMDRWLNHLIRALKTGKQAVPPPNYTRPWYRITTDKQEIIETLERVIGYAARAPGFRVSYDTETTGLRPWSSVKRVRTNQESAPDALAGSEEAYSIIQSSQPSIVFMMFRWDNPDTGEPESLGFPWDYPESELKPHLEEIAPLVLKLLVTAEIMGHNLTFDELFTMATLFRREHEHVPFLTDGSFNPDWLALQDRINLLAPAARWDTWHMAFTLLQKRGSLGLDVIAYDWVPDLAGYDEDMALLIDLHGDLLNPANGQGGHYARCPKEQWDTHLKPYVMGDVEVVHQARDKMEEKLAAAPTYRIPLAFPECPGKFRHYGCPSREWVYRQIVSPASQVLIKIMARGMHIDPVELATQEIGSPEKVQAAKSELRRVDEVIERWCQTKVQESAQERAANPDADTAQWELDLESKDQLKELLFDVLKCKIERLTKTGRKIYGDSPVNWEHLSYDQQKEYAAVDKYTLNKLAVSHPHLRPLLDYRKEYKLYNTYIRPLRNIMTARLDKRQRVKESHLAVDQCIHASFMIAGTRGGRLACRDPNLQNLPMDGEVKRLFSSRFGDRGCIYAADLSQIELRLMAAACGDESMVNAYRQGIDLHSLTASKIEWRTGKIPYEQFTKQHMEALQKKGRVKEAKDLEMKRKVSKCVDPDTLVSVNGRIVRVGNLHPGREPDTFYPITGQIQGPVGPVPLARFYSNGVKSRLLICARRGLLACSEEHPVMLKNGELKKARLLVAGDVLAEPVRLIGEPQELVGNTEDISFAFGFSCGLDISTALGASPDGMLRLPEWIFNSPRVIKCAFLAGWLSASDKPGLVKSWVLAQDFAVLMDSAGIGYMLELVPDKVSGQVNFLFRGNRKALAESALENKISQIIPLSPGHLVDVEVGTPEHLFVANSVTSRNTTNFLTGYGGGAFGLQNVLANAGVYIELEECEQIIESFFNGYPALRRFLGVYKKFILDHGVAVSVFGRVRYFEEIYSDDDELRNKALRAGCNHLIQSTASDIMLLCLVAIEALMRDEGLNSLLVSTVHDSLVIDALQSELPQIHAITSDVMNNIPQVIHGLLPGFDTSWMIVPLAGDSSVGKNYLEQVAVSGDNPDWDKLLTLWKK